MAGARCTVLVYRTDAQTGHKDVVFKGITWTDSESTNSLAQRNSVWNSDSFDQMQIVKIRVLRLRISLVGASSRHESTSSHTHQRLNRSDKCCTTPPIVVSHLSTTLCSSIPEVGSPCDIWHCPCSSISCRHPRSQPELLGPWLRTCCSLIAQVVCQRTIRDVEGSTEEVHGSKLREARRLNSEAGLLVVAQRRNLGTVARMVDMSYTGCPGDSSQ